MKFLACRIPFHHCFWAGITQRERFFYSLVQRIYYLCIRQYIFPNALRGHFYCPCATVNARVPSKL